MPPLWMLLLLFHCGWVNTAPDSALSLHLTVAYGSSVTLPCDGSAFVGEEDVEASWEALGSDVASIKGEHVTVDDRYTDHVRFSEEQVAAGDWSIILEGVVLSDSDMYECIYRGQRTLSTVWLTVEYPQVDRVVEVLSDVDNVTLPCYLDLPRTQSPDELSVWWEEDGQVLFMRRDGELTVNTEMVSQTAQNFGYFKPRNIDKFPLFLTPNMSLFLLGEFTCWYQTKESDEPKPGIPGTINVIVKELFYEADNSTEGSTEEWGSASFWFTPFGTEEVTTEEIPVTLDQEASPLEVSTEILPMEAHEEMATAFPDEESTEPLPMEAHEETATFFPDGDPVDSVDSVDWSDFPWIRTGLIAGVLLVTAAVLCILGALHKL